MKSTLHDLRIDPITSLEHLEEFRHEWRVLQQSAKHGVVHADMDWYRMMVESSEEPRSPLVLTFRRGSKLVGLIAGYRHRRAFHLKLGYLRLCQISLPGLSISYQCMIAEPDEVLLPIMAETLLKQFSDLNLHFIYTNALAVDSPFSRILNRSESCDGYRLTYPSEPHMMIRLATTIEETIARRGRQVRSSLNRVLKKGDHRRGGSAGEVRIFKHPEEIETYFKHAEAVARKTYQRALGVGFKDSRSHRKQVELAARKGWFHGHVIYKDGNPIAFQEDYVYGAHCFNPYMGYDPEHRDINPGTLLMLRSWEMLIKHTQAEVYDFGLGDGVYKERYADICIAESEILFFRREIRYGLLHAVLAMNVWTDRAIRRWLDRLGIRDRIKAFWRRRKAASLKPHD